MGTEFAIAFAGAVASGRAAHHLHLELVAVIAVATIGELCGSIVAYVVGRYGGRDLIVRFGKFVFISGADLERAEVFFARRGTSVVIFGRLIPVIRSFVSFGPGLAEMPIVRFIAGSALGCGIWCSAIASIGFAFGHSWHHIVGRFQYVGYASLTLIVAVSLYVVVRRVSSLRSERTLG
jgi:membrane protein DedA with SNARE-associated domain